MLVGKKKGRAAFAKGRMSGSLPPLLAKVNGAVQVCCKWCGDVRGWYGEEEVYGESGVGMGCVGKRWGLEGGEGEGYMGGLVWRFGAQDLGVGHGKWVWPLETHTCLVLGIVWFPVFPSHKMVSRGRHHKTYGTHTMPPLVVLMGVAWGVCLCEAVGRQRGTSGTILPPHTTSYTPVHTHLPITVTY